MPHCLYQLVESLYIYSLIEITWQLHRVLITTREFFALSFILQAIPSIFYITLIVLCVLVIILCTMMGLPYDNLFSAALLCFHMTLPAYQSPLPVSLLLLTLYTIDSPPEESREPLYTSLFFTVISFLSILSSASILR